MDKQPSDEPKPIKRSRDESDPESPTVKKCRDILREIQALRQQPPLAEG